MGSLAAIARGIDGFNSGLGRLLAWLALAMVLVQFMVVVMRYVFGVGSIFMQESLLYMHSILFLLGSGYTLLHGGHVRVDIFYREAPARAKAWIDLLGVLVFLIPVCVIIFKVSYPYVEAAWAVREGSPETSGIQGVYLLKTTILIFCVLMIAQGISMALHSVLVLAGVEEPPAEEEHEGL